jgi:hypothetical protein
MPKDLDVPDAVTVVRIPCSAIRVERVARPAPCERLAHVLVRLA